MSMSYGGDTINDTDGGVLAKRFNEVFEYRNGELYWKVTLSNIAKAGNKAGCASTNSYGSVMVDKKAYCLHRVIFCMFHGYMPEQVDHIDRDRRNHKIENLRPATNMMNSYNKVTQKNNKLGIKNVCWSQQNKKYLVQLTHNKQKVVSVLVDDLELADLVAHEARDKYHKEFANHGAKL